MAKLPDFLSSSLIKNSEDPWLPGTEKFLLHYVEGKLLHPRGLVFEDYGTAKYLQQDRRAPRDVVFSLSRLHRPVVIIERLPPEYFAKYSEVGLCQRRWGQRDDDDVVQTIIKALGYFDFCPSLTPIVDAFLRCVHVVQAPGAHIDVSHSDPVVPLSVFVSAPPRQTPHGALRVCESLLHECMHLQLSIVEKHASLVRHHKPVLRSPWRPDLRPPSGLLHGIYVFRAISKFFRWIECVTEIFPDLEYVERRQQEIATELDIAHSSLRDSDLTPVGRLLLNMHGR